jgi:hypothetical protein
MRQDTNNEIDLLLRRLSRREAASESPLDGDHLDADELNSYVENVLPPAARARYTEHLAECANCRKLVAQLSSSAGLVHEQVSEISGPSVLRKFLASLFSPMVLRYAVPALGLIVVAVIGVTVLRRQDQLASNAPPTQLKDREQSKVPASGEQTAAPSSGVVAPDQNAQSRATAPQPHAKKTDEVAPSTPNAPPSVTTVTAEVKQEAPKTEKQAEANAPESKPTATPAATVGGVATVEAERTQPQGKLTTASDRAKEKAPEPGTGAERRAEQVATASPGTAPANRVLGLRSADMAKRQRDDTKEKDKNEAGAETRSVGGRRFRKEKGVWIDTAYDSSRATVNLTRGSEQYRALVADEPTIKTIAEQLDGEIIVVWKGRAYHIHN